MCCVEVHAPLLSNCVCTKDRDSLCVTSETLADATATKGFVLPFTNDNVGFAWQARNFVMFLINVRCQTALWFACLTTSQAKTEKKVVKSHLFHL